MPDDQQTRMAVAEEQYRAARAAARDGLPQLDLQPIGAKARPRYQRIRSKRPLRGRFALAACDLPRAGQRRFLTLSALRIHMAA